MKTFLIFICFLLISMTSGFAQAKSSIQKGYAFVQVIMPGTIMVDESGNQIKPDLNISRFIYIETNSALKPNIECVEYQNEIFKVVVLPATMLPEIAGKKNGNGQKAVVSPNKGNTLWKLELQATEEKKIMKNAAPYKKIILRENLKGKHFKFIIEKEIELGSQMSV